MEIVSYQKNERGQLVLTLDLAQATSSSFLQQEEDLAVLLNEIGLLATQDLLEASPDCGQKIQLGSALYYPKQVQKKDRESLR